MKIVLGNILDQPAEIIANAANSSLGHYGGVAGVISKASGPKLQTYCDDLVKQQGIRAVSTCTMTPSFNLLRKFRHIAHVVGPIYDKNNAKQCAIELKEAVITLL